MRPRAGGRPASRVSHQRKGPIRRNVNESRNPVVRWITTVSVGPRFATSLARGTELRIRSCGVRAHTSRRTSPFGSSNPLFVRFPDRSGCSSRRCRDAKRKDSERDREEKRQRVGSGRTYREPRTKYRASFTLPSMSSSLARYSKIDRWGGVAVPNSRQKSCQSVNEKRKSAGELSRLMTSLARERVLHCMERVFISSCIPYSLIKRVAKIPLSAR